MEILIIFFLILLNGIFSMSEIALVSSRKFKLETAAKKGNINAKKALELANNPNTFLSTVQIGITLIGLLTGIYSGERVTTDIKTVVEHIDYLKPYAHSIAVFIVLIVVTYFSLVFGELVPKRIGLAFPEAISTFVARPMSLLSAITKPFIWLLTKTNDFVLRLFGFKDKGDDIVSEEEIRSIIQDSTESGEIKEIEQGIVNRVFALGDRTASELMTHRSSIAWLEINDNLDTVKQKVNKEVHSIYPVADGHLDKLLGVVTVKELFPIEITDENFKLKNFIRKPIMVHENTPVYNILEQFKISKLHIAVIIDEYGLIQGIITMDDVVDALIGDATEYNHDEYQIIPRNENSWLADGQYPFFEFLIFFGLSEQGYVQGNYNTLGGLLLYHLHHIPTAGETLKWKDFEFEVVDMDDRRIDKILIKRINGAG
ncbi:MAG: hemolysin family protein [Chitinophagaceae bacterium]